MRIADVCAFFTPHGGGVRTYAEQKFAYADAHGHELILIVPGEEDRTEARRGGRIVHVASPQFPLDRRYRYFARDAPIHALLDALTPDFVEASSPWRTASTVAAWRGAAPRSLVMHSDPLASYAYRWFGRVATRGTIDRHFGWFWNHLRRASAGFDLVVAANPGLAARLAEGGIRRVATVPFGVDPGLFSPAWRDPDLRAALLARCGLGPEAALLIGVGRHAPEKRWPTVIDAARIAGMRRPIGLVLIGDGRDHAKLVRQIAGNPHVHLLAPIEDRARLAALLASADALIHGCETETFGMVAAEAAASGLPLIVPDEGGAAAFAAPASAETYRAGDAQGAAEAVLRLLGRGITPTLAARSGAGAVPTTTAHFDALFARYAALAAPARRAA